MKINKLLLTLATASLVACGGGGGGSNNAALNSADLEFSGNSSPATVTSNNSEVIARAATEGALQAANTSDAPVPIGVETESNELLDHLKQKMLETIAAELESGEDLPIGTVEVEQGTCGGELRISYPDSYNYVRAGSYSVTAVYDNYCLGYLGGSYTYVIDGEYSAYFTLDSSYEVTRIIYSYDFTSTYTYNGETTTTHYSLASDCTYGDSYYEISCTVSDNFTGTDGRSYRVENVSGNEYYLEATVYDPEYGYFTIDADNLGYQCDNGNFSSGTITVSDSSNDDIMTITFPNCNEAVVTYNGVATTISQLY